ncbi:helix-turn-helix domain-containing protein [Candidatus Tisiphia endosymbiont of Xenochironomus xenolabis]|uniref:helix-turn-helix domain-containing protein n=1 Tax=Candidatus Tisiphia endosymbiont of Xenochironomus xenolabis TaxID=3139334 RepID=UPI0035C90D3A
MSRKKIPHNGIFHYLNSTFNFRMALVYKIQEFLKRKFDKKKINLKDFARKSAIPYSTVINITKGFRLNTDISNILKIANYFRCSIDEVIGRNDYITLPNTRDLVFHEITSEEIITNIKNFLENEVKKQNLNLYKLSTEIGFSNNSLHSFVNKREQKTLDSRIAVALADYFQVSLDEMVGRIKPNTSDNDEPSQQHTNE